MTIKELEKHQYAPLETEFNGKGEVKGYYFKQILATDKGYIYEKRFNHNITYEVFKKKLNRRFNNISYPTSKSFGKWAFECLKYENALSKLNQF